MTCQYLGFCDGVYVHVHVPFVVYVVVLFYLFLVAFVLLLCCFCFCVFVMFVVVCCCLCVVSLDVSGWPRFFISRRDYVECGPDYFKGKKNTKKIKYNHKSNRGQPRSPSPSPSPRRKRTQHVIESGVARRTAYHHVMSDAGCRWYDFPISCSYRCRYHCSCSCFFL